MGDRCSVYITCREADQPLFEAHLGTPEFVDLKGPGLVSLLWNEINYGFSGYDYDYETTTDNMVLPGIPYLGYHTEGAQYSGYVFCSDGTHHVDVTAIDGEACLRYAPSSDDPSVLEPQNETSFTRFQQHYKRVHNILYPKETPNA